MNREHDGSSVNSEKRILKYQKNDMTFYSLECI